MLVAAAVFTFHRLADEYRGKVCKNESLYKSNQYFYKIYEYGKRDRDGRKDPPHYRTQGSKNEN